MRVTRASAFALDTIEKEIDIPIIGVVKPGAKSALKVQRTNVLELLVQKGQ